MPEWIGRTVGKVRIDKYLARGGMAEVYLGTHLTLERPVAVKLLHSYIEEDADLLARFQREAKVVAGLRHPNIVQIYDFDAVNGHPYIVMEYLKGPSLAVYLRALQDRNEKITSHQVARLLKPLTSALDYAHEENVIHRDIKPGNILLHSKADEIPLDKPLARDVEVILTDFGLVRIAHTASQTMSGIVSGTPAYMSPEQARGDQVDHRTDIYSLGIVLYQLLAGRVPFEGDSTLSVIYQQINDPPPPIPGVSPAVQEVLDRALAKNPDDRYQTCQGMAVDFYLSIGMTEEAETITEVSPEKISAQAPPTVLQPKPPKRKLLWIGVGILSAVIVLALAFGAFQLFLKPSVDSNTTPAHNQGDLASTATVPVQTPTSALPSASDMVEIPGGIYEVGSLPADDYHSAPINVTLNDFWIDKYQVTNAQYQQFIDATGAPTPEVSGDANQPVRGVTWDQAVAYCSWASKRLPTEAEWEAAGRGSGPNPPLYPWGDDPSAGGSTLELPELKTYEVGTHPFNKSPFGVFDMVGNVWEWVGEPYAITPGGSKILHGGRFGLPINELSYRVPVAPDDDLYVQYAGFRCVADQVE